MFATKVFYQNDPLWKDEKLGYDQKETIGTWGCLLTSMAMVAYGFGFAETPKTLNDKLKGAGGFQGALVIPAALPNVCPGLRFKGFQPCEKTPAPLAQIEATLAAGLPVIVQVDWSPQAGVQTHWVVLYSKEANDFLMLDPYQYSGDRPEKKLSLTERYKYSGKDQAKAIIGVVWFEGPAPRGEPMPLPQPKPKTTIPADALTVYAQADGLALRAEAAITAELIKRLPLSEALIVLEDKARALPRVGQTNEWLPVQDTSGEQGFVAAWYVSSSKEPPQEAEKTAPSTGDKGFVVTPTTEGVALRSQPLISEATLIKRFPLNANLFVLEAVESARQKLGVYGQWLKVKDITGVEGFIAAWYVTPAINPALGVREDNPQLKPTVGGEIVLLTTAAGVALRSQPRIAEDTLIKYLAKGAELLVLEKGEESKIGGQGQWIKVRDIEEDVGYVAAWYVIQRQGTQ